MKTNQTVFSRFWQIGKGVALAGAIAGLTLAAPTPAHAGNGAAIGLGILGGVIAGAAIASTTAPVYGYGPPPASAYYYAQPYQSYYGPSATDYYPGTQPYYYGWNPYR